MCLGPSLHPFGNIPVSIWEHPGARCWLERRSQLGGINKEIKGAAVADEGQLRGNVNCCNWLAVAMVIAGRSAGAATGERGLFPGSSLDPHSRSAAALEKNPLFPVTRAWVWGCAACGKAWVFHGYSMISWVYLLLWVKLCRGSIRPLSKVSQKRPLGHVKGGGTRLASAGIINRLIQRRDFIWVFQEPPLIPFLE